MLIGKIARNLASAATAMACLGALQARCHASVISTSPTLIDGWTVSWTPTIQVTVAQDPDSQIQVDLQKSATFVAPNQGFQITFAPTPGQTPTADAFVFDSESITNDSGEPFGEFSFILLNSGTANATFTKVFTAPTGTGYSYSAPSIVNGDQEADYPGIQNNNVTALWGNGVATSAGNNLTISAPTGATFSFKELSTPRVPEPAISSLLLIAGFGVLTRRRSSVA